MTETMFYINTDVNRATEVTGLALDEIEMIVGRFAAHSTRAGLLRGKVVTHFNGMVEIRKSFGNKLLWSMSPDCDICSECGEHAEFDEHGSECCGAKTYDTDPDVDMER